MSSRGINKVILIGNLGQDPDMRTMANGNVVANVSIATSEAWKDRNTGEPQERTEWHRVVFFGKLAEIVGQYLKKGSKVYIDGRLQTRKWQGQDGQDRYTTEVVVDQRGTMQMLGDGKGANSHVPAPAPQTYGNGSGKPAGQRHGAKSGQESHAGEGVVVATAPVGDDFDDGIPF